MTAPASDLGSDPDIVLARKLHHCSSLAALWKILRMQFQPHLRSQRMIVTQNYPRDCAGFGVIVQPITRKRRLPSLIVHVAAQCRGVWQKRANSIIVIFAYAQVIEFLRCSPTSSVRELCEALMTDSIWFCRATFVSRSLPYVTYWGGLIHPSRSWHKGVAIPPP